MRVCNICCSAYIKETAICPYCGKHTMEYKGRLPDGFCVYDKKGRYYGGYSDLIEYGEMYCEEKNIPIPHEDKKLLKYGKRIYKEKEKIFRMVNKPYKEQRGFYPNYPTVLALCVGIPSVFLGFLVLYVTSIFAVIAGICGLAVAIKYRDGSIFLSLLSIVIGLFPIAVWIVMLENFKYTLARALSLI